MVLSVVTEVVVPHSPDPFFVDSGAISRQKQHRRRPAQTSEHVLWGKPKLAGHGMTRGVGNEPKEIP